MNDDRRHDDPRTPDRDAARALAALARLPRARPPAESRRRARAAFLAGSEVRRLPARRRGPLRTWASLLAAAALGALAVVWFGSRPAMDWVVLDVVAPDGVVASADGELAPGAHLRGGPVFLGDASELELQLGDRLRIRLRPGTVLDLPRSPGRWFGRDRHLTLDAGEIYGTSGGEPLGFRLSLVTGELEARLTGTTFAVFRTDEASCVCLWRGGIAVTPRVGGEAPVTLEEEQRVWVFKDARPLEILPLADMERMKLQMIHDAGLAAPSPAD